MKSLLEYLLKALLNGEAFEIIETEDAGRTIYTIQTEDKNKGLIIGKGGKMINTLRNILKVPATLQKKMVNLQMG